MGKKKKPVGSIEDRAKARCVAYVGAKFNGSWAAAYAAYADANGRMNKARLISFLADAGVGQLFAEPILRRLDKNKDRVIDYDEFQSQLNAGV